MTISLSRSDLFPERKSFYGFASNRMAESMDAGRLSDQICRLVLGHSPLKLMFLGRHTDLSRLLEMVMPVHDDLLFSMPLPFVSLLSIGLLPDEYGATVVTLSLRFSKNRARDAFRAWGTALGIMASAVVAASVTGWVDGGWLLRGITNWAEDFATVESMLELEALLGRHGAWDMLETCLEMPGTGGETRCCIW